MFAYQHILVILVVWLVIVFVVYLSTSRFPKTNLVVLVALILSGILIDIDHFRPRDLLKAPGCALMTSNEELVRDCPFILPRGILHSKAVGLFLLFLFLGWLVHVILDEMWTQWWW